MDSWLLHILALYAVLLTLLLEYRLLVRSLEARRERFALKLLKGWSRFEEGPESQESKEPRRIRLETLRKTEVPLAAMSTSRRAQSIVLSAALNLKRASQAYEFNPTPAADNQVGPDQQDQDLEVELLMRRALAIDEARLGPDHPNVAVRLNNLAELLQISRPREAEPLFRHVVVIYERSLGKNHPSTRLAQAKLDKVKSAGREAPNPADQADS